MGYWPTCGPLRASTFFVGAAGIPLRTQSNIVFQIAGEGDSESLRQLAGETGVGNRLQLLGSVADVSEFLEGLDVAVLASRAEGLSNSLLEYMAAGLPIVATHVGGTPS